MGTAADMGKAPATKRTAPALALDAGRGRLPCLSHDTSLEAASRRTAKNRCRLPDILGRHGAYWSRLASDRYQWTSRSLARRDWRDGQCWPGVVRRCPLSAQRALAFRPQRRQVGCAPRSAVDVLRRPKIAPLAVDVPLTCRSNSRTCVGYLAEFRRLWASVARCVTILGRCLSAGCAQNCQSWAECGQVGEKCAQTWPNWPNVGHSLANIEPNLVELGHPGFCPHSVELTRSTPRLSRRGRCGKGFGHFTRCLHQPNHALGRSPGHGSGQKCHAMGHDSLSEDYVSERGDFAPRCVLLDRPGPPGSRRCERVSIEAVAVPPAAIRQMGLRRQRNADVSHRSCRSPRRHLLPVGAIRGLCYRRCLGVACLGVLLENASVAIFSERRYASAHRCEQNSRASELAA